MDVREPRPKPRGSAWCSCSHQHGSSRHVERCSLPRTMRGRRGRHVQILLLVALLVGGLALRVTAISEPSIEQRETQSALLARRMSLGNTEILSPWKQRVLDELSVVVKPIEPPVLDFLASVHYRMSGENFWFPRLLSSLAWVIGGVLLYLIGRRLTTSAGAIVAL